MAGQQLNKDIRDFARHFALADQLFGKRFLITGATGLLGSTMVRCLLELNKIQHTGIRVIAVVRDLKKAKAMFGTENSMLHFYVYNFESGSTFIVPRVDYVVHFASPTASKFFIEKPVETMKIGFNGIQTLLDYCRRVGAGTCLFVSSLEVYGTILDDSHAVTEDVQGYLNPMEVRSSYPMAKRAAECLCKSYHSEYGVDTRIARLAQTFGAGIAKNDNRVFAQFCRNIINGEDIVLHTTGQLSRSYCYTTDAISAMLYIILKGKAGEAYNVANEETYTSVIDMARMLCRDFGNGSKPVIEPKENMGYSPVTHLRLSAAKVEALGWKPELDMHEMFGRLIASMKE